MKTHFEPISEFFVKEAIDEYNTFECDKGHKWEETLENRFNPLPINFPVPDGDNICPFCLSEFLKGIGKVKVRKVKVG